MHGSLAEGLLLYTNSIINQHIVCTSSDFCTLYHIHCCGEHIPLVSCYGFVVFYLSSVCVFEKHLVLAPNYFMSSAEHFSQRRSFSIDTPAIDCC